MVVHAVFTIIKNIWYAYGFSLRALYWKYHFFSSYISQQACWVNLLKVMTWWRQVERNHTRFHHINAPTTKMKKRMKFLPVNISPHGQGNYLSLSFSDLKPSWKLPHINCRRNLTCFVLPDMYHVYSLKRVTPTISTPYELPTCDLDIILPKLWRIRLRITFRFRFSTNAENLVEKRNCDLGHSAYFCSCE